MRGGQFDKYWRKLPHDYLNAAIFGLASWYATKDIYALSLALFMFAGSTPGWGEYIGGMIRRKTSFHEFAPIDFLIQWVHNARIWGFLGLTLRGLLWGGLLSAGTALIGHFNPWFLAAGAGMGIIYILGHVFGDFVEGNGWPISEWFFGALLWGVM